MANVEEEVMARAHYAMDNERAIVIRSLKLARGEALAQSHECYKQGFDPAADFLKSVADSVTKVIERWGGGRRSACPLTLPQSPT